MTLFAVTRGAGSAWIDGAVAFDQPGAQDHAAFMQALADEGTVLVAGPLAGSEADRIRVLLIADAASESEIRTRLEGDPWETTKHIATLNVEPWNLLVGTDRLPGADPPPAYNAAD
jgi:uncharacterized protein YciI